MTFDLEKIVQSKREYRQCLAAHPIAEKLAMLDALRDRALSLHAAREGYKSAQLREECPPFRLSEKE